MHLTPHPRFRLYGSPQNYLETLSAVLTAAVRRNDKSIAELERRVANFTGAAHALWMPRARVGIYASVLSLIRAGQNVVMSPCTYYDVINMVIIAGGRPDRRIGAC